MTSELAKTISTCSIWIATAIILTFGLFRESLNILSYFLATIIIAGAAGSTVAIWRRPKSSAGNTVDERPTLPNT